jgi:hypothetical protein
MKFNKAMIIAALCAVTTGAVYAKLPTPQLTDEQKAKAEKPRQKRPKRRKKTVNCLRSRRTASPTTILKRRKPKA